MNSFIFMIIVNCTKEIYWLLTRIFGIFKPKIFFHFQYQTYEIATLDFWRENSNMWRVWIFEPKFKTVIFFLFLAPKFKFKQLCEICEVRDLQWLIFGAKIQIILWNMTSVKNVMFDVLKCILPSFILCLFEHLFFNSFLTVFVPSRNLLFFQIFWFEETVWVMLRIPFLDKQNCVN